MLPLVAHCYLGLGRLYQRTGKLEQAQGHLTTAMTMYRKMDVTGREHSAIGATGSAWEPTPWRAVHLAAWEALNRMVAAAYLASGAILVRLAAL